MLTVNTTDNLSLKAQFRPYTIGVYVSGFDTQNVLERHIYYQKLRREISSAKEYFGSDFIWEYAVHLFVMIHLTNIQRPPSEYTLVKFLPLSKSFDDLNF